MRKLLIALCCAAICFMSAAAADMTTVWEQISEAKNMILAQVPAEKATANGFQTLYLALNSAPTTADINAVKRLTATIEENQKITSVRQQDVDVSIYAAPADADASVYKILIEIEKPDGEDKSLILLYGTAGRDEMLNTLQRLSIEDIIGG